MSKQDVSVDERAGARRELLLEAYAVAMRAADPELSVMRALSREDSTLRLRKADGTSSTIAIPGAGVRLAGLGKGAISMVRGAQRALGDCVRGGVVVAPRRSGGQGAAALREEERARALEALGLTVLESSHPLPDASSVRGGEALLSAGHQAARAGELLLVLLSGGASALAEVPLEPLTLDDLREVGRLLLASGAPIEEMNQVRKRLSRIKAGGLARAAAPSPVITLALSDVIGAPLDAIGSGPTLRERTGWRDAARLLETRGLIERLPAAVKALFEEHLAKASVEVSGDSPSLDSNDEDRFIVVGDAVIAAEAARAACEARGVHARVVGTALRGDADRFARALPARISRVRSGDDVAPCPACLIWAGELTVEVRGGGKGGRDQQLALAFALAIEGQRGVTLAALATDGMDGPSGAAGAIVDGGTIGKIRAAGLDPERALLDNDAFPMLEAAGALLETGPSGTNVNDLFLLLVEA